LQNRLWFLSLSIFCVEELKLQCTLSLFERQLFTSFDALKTIKQVMQRAVAEPVLSASRRRAQAVAQGKAQDKHADNAEVRVCIRCGAAFLCLSCAWDFLHKFTAGIR
jgi:hypothetical protein